MHKYFITTIYMYLEEYDVRFAVERSSVEFLSGSHLFDDDALAMTVQHSLHDFLLTV